MNPFRTRRAMARLHPLVALTAIAAALLRLCAVAENAGAPAPAVGLSNRTGLQAGWGGERPTSRDHSIGMRVEPLTGRQ